MPRPGKSLLSARTSHPRARRLLHFADCSLSPPDICVRFAAQFLALFFVGNPIVDALDVILLWPGAVVATREHLDYFRHLGSITDRISRARYDR